MNKHYPDRFDRGEDFSEPLEILDEYQVCGHCIHFDKDMGVVRCMPDGVGGDVYYLSRCDNPRSLFPDMVAADSPIEWCKHFAPDEAAKAAAADRAAQQQDAYGYHGLSQREFF